MYFNSDGFSWGDSHSCRCDMLHGSGDDMFYDKVMVPLKAKFQFGREEQGEFKYVGLHVKQEKESITTDQDHYVDELETLKEKNYGDVVDLDSVLDEEEQVEYRGVVGRVG